MGLDGIASDRELAGGDRPEATAEVTAQQEREATERLIPALAAAVISWTTRCAPGADRVILFHDWPSNPPLPPLLSARSDQLVAVPDVTELFGPGEGEDDRIDDAPPEYEDRQLQVDCDTLNRRYELTDDATPEQLLLAVARQAQHELAAQLGRPIWVIPVDMDNELLPAALRELLPADLVERLGLS